jgi:actin-related protein 5
VQITLGLERIRVPELLLQPRALAGVQQAGIHEAIAMALARLSPLDREACAVGGLLITGGNCSFPGLDVR